MSKSVLAFSALLFATAAHAQPLTELPQDKLRQALAGRPRCYLVPMNYPARHSGKQVRLIVARLNMLRVYFAEIDLAGEKTIFYLSKVGLTRDGYLLETQERSSGLRIHASVNSFAGDDEATVRIDATGWLSGDEDYGGNCRSHTAELEPADVSQPGLYAPTN